MLPKFFLGANYWSRVSNIQMWRDWNEKAIEDDLRKAGSIGLNSLRIFLLTKDFSDEKGNLTREGRKKLKFFVKTASTYKIYVFPSFIVGHMSGKNWPIPWDPDNSIYDPDAIEKTTRFVSQVVNTLKNYDNLGGWILSNEISNVRKPKSPEEFRSWLRTLYLTIKKLDPERPVSIGDSVSYTSDEYLMPENVTNIVDYLSPHLYLYDFDPVRHTMSYASVIEYGRSLGKDVILEEFGYPTSLYDEESHAGFIEVVLSSALMLGAKGAFVWCFSDFPREEDEPYLWEPHELRFGLLRHDGSEKPAAKVIKKFSEFLNEIGELKFLERRAAIIVPEYMYRSFPFHNMPRNCEMRALMEAYTQAKGSSILITFVREEASDEELLRYKLIFIPSISRLKTTTWRKLLRWVERGGILYYSHSRYATWPHMSASHIWEELFGIKPSLKAGLVGEFIERIELNFSKDVYPFKRGEKITYINKKWEIITSSFKPVDAEILATSDGEPALFLVKRGKGYSIFSKYPFELILSWTDRLDRVGEGYHRLYVAAKALSGIDSLFSCYDPRIEVEYARLDEGFLVSLINHSYDKVITSLIAPKGSEVEWVKWGEIKDSKEREIKIIIRPKSSMFLKFK